MAKSSSKLSHLTEILWSALLLACMGLATAHIVSATLEQSTFGESMIEQTFTTGRNPESN
jgi:uncharacterized membrane protein